MNKYKFEFRIIKLGGGVYGGTIKAFHKKNAEDKLKRKFPFCTVDFCKPAPNTTDSFNSASKNLW